ncbi:hypothetical protein BOX15_Mlig002847g2 [Macrostomum lignano]|uniref:Secreted protein n=2 Tax=Macrostomum lignano TaxID=282301 RepID=A0A1I8HEA7_9PLAT|nr:hypothetical protein BOX15_Mlig002847g2 [Macrostomum lignano]
MQSALFNTLLLSLCALCLASRPAVGKQGVNTDIQQAESTCLPEMPPGSDPPDSSAPDLLLQMHQWVWIENMTDPSWAPRSEQNLHSYYFLRQGQIVNASISLIALSNSVSVRVGILTNGKTLCMSAMTLTRNETNNGTEQSLSCNKVCFANITSHGKPMNLPILVRNQERILRRLTEYLVVDSLDPRERDSYKCLGLFTNRLLIDLPRLNNSYRQCPAGDMCLFNYDGSVIDAGCKSSFRFDWCVGNFSLCDYSSGRDCPICCRGDYCNRAVANEIYRLNRGIADCSASLLTVLTAAATVLSLLRLRQSEL